MRKRQPPTRFGQKGKSIAVVDIVKVRYVNTIDNWLAKVLAIQGGHMTVQWDDVQGPDATISVPLTSVHTLDADGGYDDDCSTIGGASLAR